MTKIPENTPIGRYTVHRFIKEGLYNDSYVVKGEGGKPFFLKLYDTGRIPGKMMDGDTVREIALLRDISHKNVISYVDDGSATIDGTVYQYLVTPYFNGKLLSEAIRSGKTFSGEEALSVVGPVLDGLRYLHDKHLFHNDITPRNILLEEEEDGRFVPKIIDLGHLSGPVSGVPPFTVQDLSITHLAPESLNGLFDAGSDVYAVSVVLYTMLFGKTPWTVDLPDGAPYPDRKKEIRQAWKEELTFPDTEPEVDDRFLAALTQGLSKDSKDRPDAQEFKKILSGEEVAERPGKPQGQRPEQKPEPTPDTGKEACEVRQNAPGKGGFADVAGMEKLKEDLARRVIWILRDKEKAAKYRLTPPNGLLLYGPPGCGKTFFAQKFAEETGFHYFLVNGSDLGSTYVHGTQNKIAELFKQAEQHAPAVICFDEFDSFVPSRGADSARHRADEVNEFLAQLNNCSARGIFVIGTTNRLDMIDTAVLRKGRLDLHVEIPAPDVETRKKMFQLHLRGRPCSSDIDFDRLAGLTDHYTAADIAFIVNEAAMVAALSDQDISEGTLEESIRCNPSSLPRLEQRKRIGFQQ